MQCLPPAGFWDHDLKPHCVDQDPLYIAIATLGLVGDIVILILPLPVVWSLKASRHQKVGLSIIFLLGSFVCVISFCRLFSLNRINPADITWTNLAPGLWTMAENQIGVVSGNLPCMRPLFMRLGARVRKLRGGYESKDETNNTAKFRSNGFTRMSEHQKGYPVGLTSAAMAMRGDPDLEFEMGLPMHGISVKTDVEQRIDNASEHSESSQARINRPAPPWREPTTSSAM
ncbi:hypothetical protein MMC13_004979 [Lambiella insularis]|nr:hypothetical protein [Lambiella insularis]